MGSCSRDFTYNLAPGPATLPKFSIRCLILEKAYVLLNVEIDSKKEVLNALDEISEVKEAHQLYGIYDLIILVEAETMEDLKDLINRIRGIQEIRSTLAMICIK